MTLSARIAALEGPDRAVDALKKQARNDKRWWSVLAALTIALSFISDDDVERYASLGIAAVFLVGAGIAHLFALLSAAITKEPT